MKLLSLFVGLTAACVALTSPTRTDYKSYLGGSYGDSAAGIAVDAAGSAYVAGTTNSPDFPLTSTALGTPSKNNDWAFVTKFNPIGTGIVFSICIADSRAVAFGMDAGGNMYLALQRSRLGFTSFVVVKLDPSGQKILYTAPVAALVRISPLRPATRKPSPSIKAGTSGSRVRPFQRTFLPLSAPYKRRFTAKWISVRFVSATRLSRSSIQLAASCFFRLTWAEARRMGLSPAHRLRW